MRIRRGTQQLKGGSGKVMVKSASAAGARKLRCPKCKELVGPSQNYAGKTVYKCRCGRTFSSQVM